MPLTRRERSALETLQCIGDNGTQVTYVGGDHGCPPFAYTAGLTGARHPELILVGALPPRVAQHLLNDLAARVLRGGQVLGHGHVPADFAGGGYRAAICGPVTRAGRDRFPVSAAEAVYGRYQVTAMQVVMQDTGYRWPWDPGYDLPSQELIAPPADVPPGPEEA
jgi:hypothetical protein